MGNPHSPPPVDDTRYGDAHVVETDHNRIALRFSLWTIFEISLLFALTFAVVAVYGRDWTFDQHAHFMACFCLWAAGAYGYAHFFLAGQRWQHKRAGGLIQSFGGFETSRLWQWSILAFSILVFVSTMGLLANVAANHEGDWYEFDVQWILVITINTSIGQGMAIGWYFSRAGTMVVRGDSIQVLYRYLYFKKINYEDIITSQWSVKWPETVEFLVSNSPTPKTIPVRVPGADPAEVDRVLLSQLGNRHTPAE